MVLRYTLRYSYVQGLLAWGGHLKADIGYLFTGKVKGKTTKGQGLSTPLLVVLDALAHVHRLSLTPPQPTTKKRLHRTLTRCPPNPREDLLPRVILACKHDTPSTNRAQRSET